MTHGNIKSAYCLIDLDTYKPLSFGKQDNNWLLGYMNTQGMLFEKTIIEMIASYGMPVGKEVFETCVWIGRFQQISEMQDIETEFIYRKDEKMNLCHSMKAKDSNIRQALIDKFGVVGTKKKPRLVLWI